MTVIRVKGIKKFKDRHGKLRVYHRKTGQPIKAEFGSGAFFEELARLDKLVEMTGDPRPGSLGNVINTYRANSRFTELASRTRDDYQKVFDYLQPIQGTPLVAFNTPLVVLIRDKAAKAKGRRFGNYTQQVLSLLFAWANERGFINTNPAVGIRRLSRAKGAPMANRPWTDQERHAVLEAAPQHLMVPIALAMFTGLREGDVLTLTRSAYQGGAITVNTAKTGQRVYLPCITPLRDVLDNLPKSNSVTIATTSRGKPWAGSGFRTGWHRLRTRLEAEGKVEPGLTIHGLRHTVAVILAEAGLDDQTIADFLGQGTVQMARHYSKGAKLDRKMKDAARKFDAAVNDRRTKVVKP